MRMVGASVRTLECRWVETESFPEMNEGEEAAQKAGVLGGGERERFLWVKIGRKVEWGRIADFYTIEDY